MAVNGGATHHFFLRDESDPKVAGFKGLHHSSRLKHTHVAFFCRTQANCCHLDDLLVVKNRTLQHVMSSIVVPGIRHI